MNPSNLTNEQKIQLTVRASMLLADTQRRIGETQRWLETRNTSTKDAKQA